MPGVIPPTIHRMGYSPDTFENSFLEEFEGLKQAYLRQESNDLVVNTEALSALIGFVAQHPEYESALSVALDSKSSLHVDEGQVNNSLQRSYLNRLLLACRCNSWAILFCFNKQKQ